MIAQVAAMIQKFAEKSEEIYHYKTEQIVVLNRVRDLVINPDDIVNKVHMYNNLMKTSEPSLAMQT